jgi:hypothetical protein
MKFASILVDVIDTENNTYWSSINPRQSFEVPLHDQKIDVLCNNTVAGKIGAVFY